MASTCPGYRVFEHGGHTFTLRYDGLLISRLQRIKNLPGYTLWEYTQYHRGRVITQFRVPATMQVEILNDWHSIEARFDAQFEEESES